MPARREECLRQTVDRLGRTSLGRELGVHRFSSLEDLRASIPLGESNDELPELAHDTELEADVAAIERDHAVLVWRHFLPSAISAPRIALLHSEHPDPSLDALLLGDLAALGGELLHVTSLRDARAVLGRLEAFGPDLLVVPSALTCAHLETLHRTPLDVRLPSLRLILAEHDLHRSLRTTVDVRSVGWLGYGGRLGVPTVRAPDNAVTLAVGSQILEMLGYSNPEEDARRVYAAQAIWPEQAIVGERYELVVTSPRGLLRRRTGEHVRVVGFDAPSCEAPFPRPRVVRLYSVTRDLRLEGCTVAGAWLAASVRQALQREDPALVQAEIAPDLPHREGPPARRRLRSRRRRNLPPGDVFADSELGQVTRTHGVRRALPRGIVVKIELQGFVKPQLPNELSKRIDRNLRHRSAAYDHLRARNELTPPRVVPLEAGTRAREENERICGLLGRVRLPEVRVVPNGLDNHPDQPGVGSVQIPGRAVSRR